MDERAKLTGSHLPILMALVEVLHPGSAIECGCGLYSTPLLSTLSKLWAIEHDAFWAKRMRREVGARPEARPGHTWIADQLDGVVSDAKLSSLSDTQVSKIDGLYEGYSRRIASDGRVDILFVDTYAAARGAALMLLGPLANVIVLHDTEPRWRAYYDLGHALDAFDGHFHYSYRPPVDSPHTDIWSVHELDTAALLAVADPIALKLWNQTAPLVRVP